MDLLCGVEDGGVSSRCEHACKAKRIKTPEEVARADVMQLKGVPDIGEKRAKRIKEEALRKIS